VFSFFFLLIPLFKTTDGVVVGFPIIVWAPNSQNIRIPINKKFGDPLNPPHYAIFGLDDIGFSLYQLRSFKYIKKENNSNHIGLTSWG
jgi:hypothetical protein